MVTLGLWTGSAVVALVLTLAVMVLAHVYKIGQRPADLPPGPPTIPILGNLHQMPKDRPYLQFRKWADEYGFVCNVDE
jgi:hypothetical protein